MLEFDVFSDELAECLYLFIDNNDLNDSYSYYRESFDYSMAQFVNECYLDEFRTYCADILGYRFIDC